MSRYVLILRVIIQHISLSNDTSSGASAPEYIKNQAEKAQRIVRATGLSARRTFHQFIITGKCFHVNEFQCQWAFWAPGSRPLLPHPTIIGFWRLSFHIYRGRAYQLNAHTSSNSPYPYYTINTPSSSGGRINIGSPISTRSPYLRAHYVPLRLLTGTC
jgi:hypothetical protein